MSGTSMDGIDAVLMEWSQHGTPLLHASLAYPWEENLKTRLAHITSAKHGSLQELGELDIACGQQFAKAVQQLLDNAGIAASAITAIGSHGQTIYHHPHGNTPFSMQIGDPNTIAQSTGIPVVADFRGRDMAAGGQGAPLVPAFHQAIFSTPPRHRVILNIGGIANITILSDNGKIKGGFDTGPGNCLLDRWIQKSLGKTYDRNGQWAAEGITDPTLLKQLLSDPYFVLPPPKSTGTEYFALSWLEKQLDCHSALAASDIQSTLLQLSSQSIAQAIKQWAPETEEVLVCGGGAHNSILMQALSEQLEGIHVGSTLDHSPPVDPDWVEAMAFAWLAMKNLQRQPGNIPAVTGASEEVILGAFYPANLV